MRFLAEWLVGLGLLSPTEVIFHYQTHMTDGIDMVMCRTMLLHLGSTILLLSEIM